MSDDNQWDELATNVYNDIEPSLFPMSFFTPPLLSREDMLVWESIIRIAKQTRVVSFIELTTSGNMYHIRLGYIDKIIGIMSISINDFCDVKDSDTRETFRVLFDDANNQRGILWAEGVGNEQK